MLTGIDHLAIAVPDLDAAVAELRDRVGIAAGGGGVHPGAGTANRLAWFADSYLELITIVDRAAAADSFLGGPTIEVLDTEGSGFVTFVLASDDLAADVSSLRSAGSTMSDPFPGERRRPDGRLVRWSLARAGAVGAAEPPFLIEHDVTAAEWTAAERAARAVETHPMGGSLRLTGLDLIVADPLALSRAYQRAVGLVPAPSSSREAAGDWVTVAIGDQSVVLRVPEPIDAAAPPSPRTTIHLSSTGARSATADLFGCRFTIEAG